MAAKTRRRLIMCLVAVALTLPAETILLQALSTTSTQAVAQQWVASLPDGQVSVMSKSIQLFPFAYRREIMRRLSPGQRAAVWQNHITQYIGDHPELDDSIVAMLYNAASLITPREFDRPTDAVRTEIGTIAEQIRVVLGKAEADYLFYRLGPRDNAFASAEPIGQRLANYVRGIFVVQARTEDCDCSTSFGCDEPGHCSSSVSCNRDENWPMCGWFWNQVCDGLCLAGLDLE